MEKIIKGDEVIVITGKDKGRRGVVLSRVDAERVLVEGVNRVKKHVKPNPMKGVAGGIVDKDMPIHISNVALFNPATKKADRVAAEGRIAAAQDGAKAAGVLIALNRQERGQGELSAIQEVERDFQIPVVSIVALDQVLEYLAEDAELKRHLPAVEAYRGQFGI